jgi:AcrR family transcriptional regulator
VEEDRQIMVSKENPRPGGRSARVQATVHAAVSAMLLEMERSALTIPLIAQRANVTPSTIYRRWGDLGELLADVALARLQPETEPGDSGNPRTDLAAWVEQYADEMASKVGRQLLHDVLATGDRPNVERCCAYTRQQLAVIVERAAARNEAFPSLQELMDHVVSPIIFRILFDHAADSADVRQLVERVLPADGGSARQELVHANGLEKIAS